MALLHMPLKGTDMDSLRLLQPAASYARQVSEYRQEFLDAGDSMDGTGPLRRFADPLEWMAEVERYRRRETVPEGLVEATQFLCVREADDRLVGMIQIRHRFNEYLEKYAGHVGYSVRPSERRKGYAGRMLGLALPCCRALGLKRVLISCHDFNEASRRTILANGGVYESTVQLPDGGGMLERYWIEL